MYQFFSVTLRNYRSVGTVWPSSRALSRELARSVAGAKGAKRVLEVGPGTGPVTRTLLETLRPGDRFDLVELHPEFCDILRTRVLGPWQRRNPKVDVNLHQCPVEKAPLPAGSYDHIVSGLPFNNFPAELVRQIMDRYFELLKPDGTLSYFAYAGIRPVKGALVGAASRRNLKAIAHLEEELLRRHRGQRRLVLANIPPASVQRMSKVAAS